MRKHNLLSKTAAAVMELLPHFTLLLDSMRARSRHKALYDNILNKSGMPRKMLELGMIHQHQLLQQQ
jgi:hypothetical protein